MTHRIAATTGVLLLTLAVAGASVRAEVSAELNSSGQYVGMVVTSDSMTLPSRVWAVTRPRPTLRPLNPEGDLNGDLFPAILEANSLDRTPWVVWSRYAGANYDLVYARWDSVRRDWSRVAWVQPVVSPGDDVAPALAFDGDARPHLVWSRDEGGLSHVYLSVWLQTRWMDEYLVSDPEENAVAPAIQILPDRRIEVRYNTPTGQVIRIVSFVRPRTITDDITPFGRMRIDETRIVPLTPR